MTKFEAAVIGAGPTGLVAALALASKGIEVAVVAPPYDDAKAAADRRTTALIGPSVQLMRNLGVWGGAGWVNTSAMPGTDPTPRADPAEPDEHQTDVGSSLALDPTYGCPTALGSDPQGLTPHAAPIAAIRVADDRGGLLRAPEVLFRASEIGLDSFGSNLPNPALLAALGAAARRASRLTWVETAAVTSITPGASSVRLTLAGGGNIEATLAVAADGRNSRAPDAAGIGVRTWEYPQAAVVASFSHSRPHDATVNELHRHAGPLTTVPLPGLRSALVWVENPAEARRLAGLADAAFAAELEERLQGALGATGDPGPRALHPLGGRRTERMAANRVALVGEAAHVVAPIGAQGLNLGLRDAAALADCAAEAKALGQDLGGEAVLAAYDRARRLDVLTRTLSIDLLNRSLLMDILPVEMLRGAAAHALARFAPLRQALMEAGAGLAGLLPSLMRKGERW